MGWLIPAAIVLMLWLRQSVVVVAAATLLLLYALYDSGHAEYVIYDLWEALNRESLLIIPMFLVAGALLSRGGTALRLVEFLQALMGPVPGGVAIASVFSITLLSALLVSPVVAILAVGPVLFRAMTESGCRPEFSIGLLCASSVVGVMLPASLPLVLYSVVTETRLADLYAAGAGVACVLVVVLAATGVFAHWQGKRKPFVPRDLYQTLLRAVPALCPLAVLFIGSYSERLTSIQCAALFLITALVVEAVLYRLLSRRALVEGGLDLCHQIGRTLPLVALSISFTIFLTYQEYAPRVLSTLGELGLSQAEFLLVVNLVLLIGGMAAEMVTAVLLMSPVIEPVAAALDIDSAPFGVMLVLNLALGYLTPPSGLVLMAAMIAFRENFLVVLKAVAPFFALLLAAVFVAALLAI